MLKRISSRFFRQYVSEEDRVLLNCVFAVPPTQQILDECLRVCDIEAMGAHKSLMLSYLMHEHPHLKFSDYAEPRLKGLINYFRFANIKTLAHFSKIGKALNEAGIPMLIIKGAAMKLLRPDLSRPMSDVDIIVQPRHMAEAVRLCEELGYHDARTGSAHAVDMHTAEGEAAVDIHHSIFNDGEMPEFHSNLRSRATELTAFGVRALLPCHEDLLFIVLHNLMNNLHEKTTTHGLFYALCDCKFLLAEKPAFDWAMVRDNARTTGTELKLRLAAEFIEGLVPGLLPDVERNLPFTKDMENFCNRLIFDEDYLMRRQEQCRNIRVVDLKNYPLHYGKMILKLLVLKKMRSFPSFVRWYLASRGGEVKYAR